MISLQFPSPQFKTRYDQDQPQIFDALRKKWVALTPEEWVRQNIITWLIQVQQIPSLQISVERSIEVGGRMQRFDMLIFNHQHQPWMLIECKAQGVTLDEKVLMQVLRYNSSIPVKYAMITNGAEVFISDLLDSQRWLDAFPVYPL